MCQKIRIHYLWVTCLSHWSLVLRVSFEWFWTGFCWSYLRFKFLINNIWIFLTVSRTNRKSWWYGARCWLSESRNNARWDGHTGKCRASVLQRFNLSDDYSLLGSILFSMHPQSRWCRYKRKSSSRSNPERWWWTFCCLSMWTRSNLPLLSSDRSRHANAMWVWCLVQRRRGSSSIWVVTENDLI